VFAQFAASVTASNANASVQDVVDAAVSQGALNGFSTAALDSIINTVKEHEYAGDASELSQIGTEEGMDMGGGDVLFPDGFDAITNFLAIGLNIQTETIVETISYTETGVTLSTNKGEYRGDRVIVTVPLGVLKAGDFGTGLWCIKQSLARVSKRFLGQHHDAQLLQQTQGPF